MMTKNEILKLARPLLVKYLTRGAVWLLTAWFGYSAATAETDGGLIGMGAAAGACALLGLLIDRWHHRKDLAEPPQ